jgi:hypothetical protein
VGFQGSLIHCSTIQDALAIKLAGAALAGEVIDETPEQLYRLAGVLRWYDLPVAADEMAALAGRERAGRYLQRTIGYVRHGHDSLSHLPASN